MVAGLLKLFAKLLHVGNENNMTVEHARIFSIAAHSAAGQLRKHSGKPYHTHPQDVVDILKDNCGSLVTFDMIMAAYLHDVVEDTHVGHATILELFGPAVTKLVIGMTKLSYEGAGSTPKRKDKFTLEVFRLSLQSPEVKTIKIADSIANMRDFIREQPEYARKVYLPEKRILLDEALKEGDNKLWMVADQIIKDFMEK